MSDNDYANDSRTRRVVIVGIPGVGKSTVVGRVVEILQRQNFDIMVVNYGTVMMEQAAKLYSVKSRDDMRKLSVNIQRKLQVYAATEISKLQHHFVIVDTHLFISTSEGFWPGMPMDVLQALRPTNLILVVAKADEIASRRQKDATRVRDQATKDSLERELAAAVTLLYASSLVCGCPALIVENPEGTVDIAAERIINAVISN